MSSPPQACQAPFRFLDDAWVRNNASSELADELYKHEQRYSRHLAGRGAGITRVELDAIRAQNAPQVVSIDDPSDPLFLAVHGLAVKKSGNASEIAVLMQSTIEEVESSVCTALEHGFVANVGDKFMLTPTGADWLSMHYPKLFAQHRSEPGFSDAYDRFEVINRQLLNLMTRWQTMAIGGQTVTNDHSDKDYDEKIIDELDDLHERAMPILAAMCKFESRLGVYANLLRNAYERVLDGHLDYMSAVKFPSYHTVWFEMHEDLLRILGRVREAV